MPKLTYSAVTKNNEATVIVTGQKEIISERANKPQLTTTLPQITGGVNFSSKLTLHKVCTASGQAVTPTSKAFHQGERRKEKIVSQRKKATSNVNKNPTACAARSS